MARGADADVHEVALTLEDSLRQVISASKPAAPAVAEQRLLSLDTHGAKLETSAHELIDGALALHRRELNNAYQAVSQAATERESTAAALTAECHIACTHAQRNAEALLARIEGTLAQRQKKVPAPADDEIAQLAAQRR